MTPTVPSRLIGQVSISALRPAPTRLFPAIGMYMAQHIGYCTNVHAGATLEQTMLNLRQHATDVKAQFCPDREMGIGLWLSANSAIELERSGRVIEFADWLDGQQLVPFTLNGFPYGDFHEPVVKHRVYEPSWYDPDRLAYTETLIRILHKLLPPGIEGSISTLPICWGDPAPSPEAAGFAATQLRRIADQLAELEEREGRLIYLCIEPEPGCYLQRSEDIVEFFRRYVLPGGNPQRVRRYLRVCHDVCHAAVMFESQDEVLGRYRAEGIGVGKVQVSSAVCVDFQQIPAEDRAGAVEQLAGFAEDRYLHQTSIREGDAPARFYEDLPQALASIDDPEQLTSVWSIHFHVPIYLDRFGHLGTSRLQIQQCLEAVREHPDLCHFEVETYAWGVLPADLRQPKLSTGIARELEWFVEQLDERP